MRKSLIALSALCTLKGVLADWEFQVTNNAGQTVNVPVAPRRYRVCLSTSQTNKIKNTSGGVMRLFSTKDCTGNFVALYRGSTQSNAQWVNSASIEKSINMHKSLIALLALCTLNGALADWDFQVTNNAGQVVTVPVGGRRYCGCLSTSQTNKIKNTNGGVMRLFSTKDCTGNFVTLYRGSTQSNAQWVNSASIGEDGIPSDGPYHCDPVN